MSRRDDAIVAWHEVPKRRHPKTFSRRVGCDSCRCAHRFDDRNEEISNLSKRVLSLPKETGRTLRRETPSGISCPDHTVPTGRFLRGVLSQALRARLRSGCPSGTGCVVLSHVLLVRLVSGGKGIQEGHPGKSRTRRRLGGGSVRDRYHRQKKTGNTQ